MGKILKGKKFFTFEKWLACFTGILLVMLAVFSCNNMLVKDGGSLVIALPGARAATASSFTIELTGTSGAPQSKTVAGGTTVQFDDLAPGAYNIVVEGKDESGVVVFYGTSSATVTAGERASAIVELKKGVSDFASLKSAVEAGGTVYIFESIDVETTLSVPSGISVTILPAYQDVTLKNIGSGSLFDVNSGELTIGGGEYTITLDGDSYNTPTMSCLIQVNGSVTINLNKNSIVMNNMGCGLKLTGETNNKPYLYLNGGIIKDNQDGGVFLSAAEFVMNSGSIEGNSSSGVLLSDPDSLFIMKGGKISGNLAAGVSVGFNSQFVMEGGSIEGNSYNYMNPSGGGVYVQGSFTMKGGRIAGNIASTGGGVSISSSGQFIMEGGLIEGNTAESLLGSGVYFGSDSGGDFTMSGSAVVAPDNDVYLPSGRTITITGELTGSTPVATITLYDGGYTAGTAILTNGMGDALDLATESGKFAVTPNPADGSEWIIDTAGILQKGISDFASLQAAVAAGGTVYVLKSIDVSSVLTVETTVEILPAYQDVTLKNIGSENLFFVRPNGNLTIGGGEHTITLNGNQVAKEILKMTGGIVTLTPNGIISNAASTGVSVHGGTFYMTGGSITGNIGSDGGGVNLSSATFNMTGGSISGNTVTGSGGAVYMSSGAFSMTGGSIDNNSAVNDGNGVYISTGAFSMSGSAVIASNNDVYLDTGIHITVSGAITAEDEFIATLTPASYAASTQVLYAGDAFVLAAAVSKFAVTPDTDGKKWTIDASGNLKEQ